MASTVDNKLSLTGVAEVNRQFLPGSERVLNPGFLDLKASTLTTGPHCLQGKYDLEKVSLNYKNFSPGIKK